MKDDLYTLWMMSLKLSATAQNKLIQQFGTAKDVFDNAQSIKGQAAKHITPFANGVHLDKVSSLSNSRDFKFISQDNPKFPTRLKNIADPPLGIFVKGNLPNNFDDMPTVGIVGSRDNTLYGRKVTKTLSKDLAALGFMVISGMARGLDAHAHKGALEAKGETIAVLPCSVDKCYPQENRDLYKQIPQNGALISEYFPGTKIENWHFLARNRIISALSDALIITEAATRSGTFSTATHALNQGKDVLAVPGDIFSKQSEGTNLLIKDGAVPITSYLDVVAVLKSMAHLKGFFSNKTPILEKENSPIEKISLASDENLVYSCINYEPVSIEYIVYKTELNVSQVNKILFDLELDGRIVKLPGNKYIKK